MRLLDRYLLRELLFWLGICLGGLVVFVIAFDLIASLNRIQEHQLLFKDVAELYLVKLPPILVVILPIALLIALLAALTTHARHNELVAMRAAGVSLWRLCLPYLTVGLLLSAAFFALNELWVPDSETKIAEIMDRRMHPHGDGQSVATQTTAGFYNARDKRTWVWDNFYLAAGVLINPKVDWESHGTRFSLFARRAEHINGTWFFYGSTSFTTNDFANLDSFAGKLKQPTNALAQFLSEQISTNAGKLLAQFTNYATNAELKRALAVDLNRIVRHGPLYEEERFAGIKLSPVLQERVAQNKHGTQLIQVNRELLFEAYPEDFTKTAISAFNSATLSRTGAAVADLATNVLAMPQFAETPRDFANEAKFNSRFQNPSTDSAGVPIVEIQDYLKLHPDLSEKNRAWLYTQLHGRFSQPWTCLVVVLVAIPFGAASGRRNIFAGVAGSIVLVFAYFIIFRLGLAAGYGGKVPPWLAAWFPNALFGLGGIAMILRVR